MITKENTYKQAFEIKKKNLNLKIKNRERSLAEVYSSKPRLSQIDDELSALGAQLAITALSGDAEKISKMKLKSQSLSAEKEQILKQNGVEDVNFDCPLCQDTGYLNGKICDCVKILANNIAVKSFSEEMPLDECKFENFNLNYYSENGENSRRRMNSILNLCKEYVTNFNPKTSQNLLFLGGPGLGKTHLTLAIVSGVIDKGYFPVYGSADNLFSIIEKEKFDGQNKGSYELMLGCDLLVIDDLGTELVTSFTKSALYNLINTRMLTKHPTVINTNLTLKEIETIYSPRIASRLIGNFNANKFLGVDVRQQKILGKQSDNF